MATKKMKRTVASIDFFANIAPRFGVMHMMRRVREMAELQKYLRKRQLGRGVKILHSINHLKKYYT